MRATIYPKRLAFALECAKRATASGTRRNMTPILECAEIDIDPDGGLVVRGTDLALDVAITIGTEHVEGPHGVAGIGSAAKLLKIAKAARSETVDVDVANDEITIYAGKSKYRVLPPIRGNEYPNRPELPGDTSDTELDGAALADALQFVLRAASPDDGRPHLNGVLFDAERDVLVATDGHRLHRAALSFDNDHAATIVPLGAAKYVEWLLGKIPGGVVTFSASRVDGKARCAFEFSGYVGKNGNAFFVRAHVVTRTCDGRFPPYDKVIPRQEDARVDMPLDPADVVAALKDVMLFGVGATRWDIKPDVIEVRADSPDEGEATSQIDVRTWYDVPKDGLQIGFNGRYVLDFCASLPKGSAEIRLRAYGPSDPTRFEYEGKLAIIMTMRL